MLSTEMTKHIPSVVVGNHHCGSLESLNAMLTRISSEGITPQRNACTAGHESAAARAYSAECAMRSSR